AIKYIKGLGDVCLQYGIIYQWRFFNVRKTEKYFRQAIFWHQKIQDDNGLGFGYKGLGTVLLEHGFADEANKAFEQSALHFRKAGNEVMLADLTDQLSYVFGAKGDFEKRFELVKKAFREKRKIRDSIGLMWSYYHLAKIYQLTNDHETALDYFRKTIKQAISQSLSFRPYRSVGRTFLYMGNYDSSFYYFYKMLQIIPSDGPSLAGLGKLYMLRKEYDTALNYLRNALTTFRKNNNIGDGTLVMVDIGKTYAQMKQYLKALQYARECLTTANQISNKFIVQSSYELHWNLYERLHMKDSAYFYFQKFVSLRDSLKDALFKRQLIQKLALFKVESREEQQQARINLLNKENKIKHQQLQKEALMKKILAGTLVCITLLSIIILRNIALKRRNEKHRRELAENELQIQKLETERTKAELQQQATQLQMQALRAQMNPHFIFNSLNSINRFILKKQSREAAGYLTKFSRLIRMILNSSANATVNLAEDLAALELYMELESLRFDQKFVYKIQIDPDVDANFIQIPPMLLQPFVENAIWHGLMLKKGEGHLWVNICQEDSMLVCTITDNGIGREKSAEIRSKSAYTSKSMGMAITADRIKLLQKQKAFIQVTDLVLSDGTAGGTEVLIKIPVMYD
ncbi:MAG TPA: histidine kinase, partial [Segetibacter sp.]|nr:histidine kinase [Segetibacter sp.]